jgi:hypothetical protein
MPKKPWSEELDFYHSEMHGQRLLVTLDMGAEAVAPLAGYPVKIQVSTDLARPRIDGLRDRSEADELFRLEDEIQALLGGLADVLYVGRVVGFSQLYLVWYGRPESRDAALQLPTALASSELGYTVRVNVEEDPGWTFYLDFLMPDVFNLQVMLNRRRLLTLADHGDDGATARDVDHRATFPTRTQAAAAAAALEAAGFDCDAAEPDEDDEDGERWALHFARVDPLAEGRINDVCVEILDLILPHEGDYEGWGVPLRPSVGLHAVEGRQ